MPLIYDSFCLAKQEFSVRFNHLVIQFVVYYTMFCPQLVPIKNVSTYLSLYFEMKFA